MKHRLQLAAILVGAVLAGAQTTEPGPLWLKGDLHVHDDHSSDGSLPRQRARDRAKGNASVADQIGQAERMGLQFLPLTDHRTYDQHYDPLWESSRLVLIPGEEANGSPHANVFGGVDSIVQGADRAQIAHIQQSVWNAHSQGAVWQVNHPDDGEVNEDGTPNARASVQGADLVEIWNRASDWEKEIDYAENRWTAGFRFGVAGSSDNHFKEYWERQGPGLPTTRVFASARNERGVLDGLRAGRNTISIGPDGPVVHLTAGIGRRLTIEGGEIFARRGTKGRLFVQAERAKGMQVLVYRQPGRSAGPIATFTPSDDNETFTVPVIVGDSPDWYRAEIRGLGIPLPRGMAPLPDPPPAPVMELKAIASPVFISTGPVEARPEIHIPADQGRDDGALMAAGAAGGFTGFPDVAKEGGVTHLVAETHGPGTSTVVYRSLDARGRWSRADRVLSGSGLARFPKVAARGRDVWVTWQEDSTHAPHRPVIKLRRSTDGGATWQAVQTVRALEGRAERPDIAVTAAGRPLVVWQEIRAGQPFDIMAQEVGAEAEPRNLTRTGKTFGPGSADDSRSARFPASVWPAVSAGADGRIAVAWQDNRTDVDPLWTGSEAAAGTNPDTWQIQVAVRDAAGRWGPTLSLGADDMADRHPDVSFGGRGELVVAWETKTLNPAGRNLSIQAATSTDGGATFASPVTLAPDPQAMGQVVRLGADADGRVRAVWYDSRSADWRWRVITTVLGLGGWDRGVLLDGRGNNSWPATSGGVVVFAGTRNATRLQRDQTQQVFLLPAP